VRAGPFGIAPQSACAHATPGKIASNIAVLAARIALRGAMIIPETISDIPSTL
jgi:hypothetical protein